MNKRDETLRAVSKAADVLAASPSFDRTSFDIIGAITEREIPLFFRPLDHLLGAFVPAGKEAGGIIVTSRRGLAIQRFTLAHEFGHFLLGHQPSLDKTVEFAGRYTSGPRVAQELAADTFASELLAAKHLMVESAKRHGWSKEKLHQPDNIYQLSLRLGVSYQAACWGLVTSEVLTPKEAKKLQETPVKDLKHALAPGTLIANSWADVWALTRGDAGTFLEAGPKDLFAVHLQDNVSAGYLWRLVDTGADAEIVGERPADLAQVYGRPSTRVVYVRFNTPGTHRLAFEHTRPWSGATLDQIEIKIDGHGRETVGLARRAKVDALANAA